MFIVYVLYSPSSGKTYTGFSADFESRFISHNLGTKGYTLRYRPWTVLYTEKLPDKKQAMKRQKYLKTGVGREFIKELIRQKYQE